MIKKYSPAILIIAILIMFLAGMFNGVSAFGMYAFAVLSGLQMGAMTYGVSLYQAIKNYKAKGVSSFYKWAALWVIAFVFIVAVYRWEM